MDTVFELPAHPLWAHLTVVAIPVAAVLAGVVAVFPRAPRLVKITTLLLGGLSVALVPLMESSGKALVERVAETAAVERHAEMGETLLPWMVGLFVVIVAVLAADWWLRPAASSGPGAWRQASGTACEGRCCCRGDCGGRGRSRVDDPHRSQRRAGHLVDPWRLDA